MKVKIMDDKEEFYKKTSFLRRDESVYYTFGKISKTPGLPVAIRKINNEYHTEDDLTEKLLEINKELRVYRNQMKEDLMKLRKANDQLKKQLDSFMSENKIIKEEITSVKNEINKWNKPEEKLNGLGKKGITQDKLKKKLCHNQRSLKLI